MTFEEMQKIIEGMLAVQRQLQESQFELRETHEREREVQEREREMQQREREMQEREREMQQRERETLQTMKEEIDRFIERSNRNERRIEQLIGYSITNESEHLDIEQRFRNLEARMIELENQK